MPDWLARPIAAPGRQSHVRAVLDSLELDTVCESARCPNRGECFGEGTATFLVMGDVCTRSCSFCAVSGGAPAPLDAGEPRRVAEAAERMGLDHVVVTCVTRDDLPDGGAAHLAAICVGLAERLPRATVEVLTSDFAGDLSGVDAVLDARPSVFNHNVETVRRLYASVRPEAVYERSLAVLARASAHASGTYVKSGLMVGLGETHDEVVRAMRDIRETGASALTIGQYLRPTRESAPVAEFVEPARFERLADEARELGFSAVASGPFVRSSYRAAGLMRETATRG
jgi:lipoic acid synthetase